MAKKKCELPEDFAIRPDGEHEIDPCDYVLKETHKNVTVEVLQCRKCGHVSIVWKSQEDSEHEIYGELEESPETDMKIFIALTEEIGEEDG